MALTVSIFGVEGSKLACKLQLYICFRVYNLFAMKVVFSMDFYVFFLAGTLCPPPGNNRNSQTPVMIGLKKFYSRMIFEIG